MNIRRRFRRLRRMAWLAAIIGGVVGVRKMVAARQATPSVGPVASWPPLQRSEPPVAAVGDLVTASETTVDEPDRSPEEPAESLEETVVSDEPVATIGELATEADLAGTTWVAPVEGTCPSTHPIKANDNSMIYHEPSGQLYERTQAERCYANAADAEADGYRAARGS